MYIIENKFNNRFYYFSPIFGFLYSRKKQKKLYKSSANNFSYNSEKIKRELNYINNPFLIKENPSLSSFENIPNYIFFYAKFLIWCYKHSYPLLYIISKFRFSFFDNAESAINYFCKINPKDQKILCLPRSIFAATTSKEFKKNGIMVIGVFHPTRHMHAWIMEKGKNSYLNDDIWINYSPVAIME